MLTSKGEIINNTNIVGDFNIPVTPMDRSTKHRVNKETQILKRSQKLVCFTDKQKLREFSTTKPALQQMQKDLP